MVVTRPFNVLYVAGYHSGWVDIDSCGIVPRSPQIPTTLVVAHRGLVTLAADRTWVKNIRTFNHKYTGRLAPKPGQHSYRLHPTSAPIDEELQRLIREARHIDTFEVYEALATALRELGLDRGRLGFDEREVGDVVRERHLPDMTPSRAFELVRRIRMVKTPHEIEELRAAGRINRAALEETLGVINEGSDLAESAITYKSAIVRRGGVPAPHGGYGTGAGERSLAARYHHTLKKGDVMWVSGVSSYNSYYSDMVRTYIVGPLSSRQAEAHRLLETAFAQLEPVQRLGTNSSEVAKSVIQTVTDGGGDVNGLEMNIHTMGVEIVELQHQPWEKGFCLETNVCFCVFLLYKPESDVFAIEHNYVVTDDGWEQLDTFPHGLIQVS